MIHFKVISCSLIVIGFSFHEKLLVLTDIIIVAEYEITIVNKLLQVVEKTRAFIDENTPAIINASSLEGGIYFQRIQTSAGQIVTTKFMKVNYRILAPCENKNASFRTREAFFTNQTFTNYEI